MTWSRRKSRGSQEDLTLRSLSRSLRSKRFRGAKSEETGFSRFARAKMGETLATQATFLGTRLSLRCMYLLYEDD